MEVFILDTLLRRIDVVDEFVSLIWTERRKEKGDMELVVPSTLANRLRFVIDTYLSIEESKRIMRVETVEETVDLERGPVLRIKAYDLVSITEARPALERIDSSTISPVWTFYGYTPGDIMRAMFDEICSEGTISMADIIPFINTGPSIYPSDTIPEPEEEIDWIQKPTTLYAAIKELADIYDLGFRLYKDPDIASLYFNVYAGSDRTTRQTELPPVIFSADMENLQDTTELTDTSKSFNVVRVLYIRKNEPPEGEEAVDIVDSVQVVDSTVDPSVSGIHRRVKLHVVTSVPEEIADLGDYLYQLGVDELAKSRPLGVFEGEVNQYSQYVYERDYYLGDLIEIRGNNGAAGYMRVEEQIFAEDASGFRSYPAFTTNSFASPGTWRSWKYDVEWQAMGSEEYWSNQ
jgi:hypothetical protein